MNNLNRLLQMEDRWKPWRSATCFSIATFQLIMFSVSTFVIISILRNPVTRSFSFNLYVVFILAPDALFNAIDATQLLYWGIYDGVVPTRMCFLRQWWLMFYYFSNIVVNAAVAMEVYSLVCNSYKGRRMKPPTNQKVLSKIGSCYVITILLACWFVIPWRGSLLTVHEEPICTANFGSEGIPFLASFFVSVSLTTPWLFYVFWVGYKVKTGKLLPLNGRTRALALFFFRIVGTFLAFYAPIFILSMIKLFIEDTGTTKYFVLYSIISLLAPCQNLVSINFLMGKEDISKAVLNQLSSIYQPVRASIITFSFSRPGATDDDGHVSQWFMDDVYEEDVPVLSVENPISATEKAELSGMIDSTESGAIDSTESEVMDSTTEDKG